MMMRLAFAITTSVRPDILLMDEWLAVGDAEFRKQAEERIASLVASSGILVLASHSADLIARECNRVIELSHGSIVRDEPCHGHGT
jgi:lipopolysaccharide transport system ATP-binding protein